MKYYPSYPSLGKKNLACLTYTQFFETEFSCYGTMEFYYGNKQFPFSAKRRATKKVMIDNEIHTYSFEINPDKVVQNITKIRIDPLTEPRFYGEDGVIVYIADITLRDGDNELVLNISSIIASRPHNVKSLGGNTFQVTGEDPYFTIELPQEVIISDRVSVDVNTKYFSMYS